MKKVLKVLSTSLLLSTLFVTGCSCSKDDKVNVSRFENNENKVLSNLKNGASDYSLLDIYNALIAADYGNKAVANKLLELVAKDVLEFNSPTSPWPARYETLVKERLKELAESGDYDVKGEFSEKYFVESLRAEGYNITCPAGVTYGTPDQLACDYTAYENNVLKADVLSTLLKEKYIEEVTLVERKNVLTNKKIRDVEYLTFSSSLDKEYDELSVRDFARKIRDDIAAKKEVKFDVVSNEFKQKLKDIIQDEVDKIGTDKDYNKNIEKEYTNTSTQDPEVGKMAKFDEIDKQEYNFNKVIGSDSEANEVISEAITSTLLSITDPTDTSFSRKVIPVTDEKGNTYYYLVNANAGSSIDASDVLLSETSDSSTYTYSIVRFRVINSDTTDSKDLYNAIKLLASKSTLANSALSHYVKEKKDVISVYDDEVYAYLQKLYPDVFAD